MQPDKVAIGQECQLTMGKNKKHNGIVVARGKENTNVIQFCSSMYILGTQVEMDKLEDQFVTGDWVPPTVTIPVGETSTPTAPKRKTKKRKQKMNSNEAEKEKTKRKRKKNNNEEKAKTKKKKNSGELKYFTNTSIMHKLQVQFYLSHQHLKWVLLRQQLLP